MSWTCRAARRARSSMVARKPSAKSPTKSSPARSKAGSDDAPAPARTRAPRAATSRRAAAPVSADTLLESFARGEFPATLYLDGPDEGFKAVLLAELRHAWAAVCPEAPLARVFRPAETGVDELLAAVAGRLAGERVRAEAGVLEAVADACDGDAATFVNELAKLIAWSGNSGTLTTADVETVLRPVLGADLPGYLGAVAGGDVRL